MIKTGMELADIAKKISNDYKTLYVLGCIGAPLNDGNKKRYTENLEYNRKPSRKKKILTATNDTFGFDCVCLIKSILWGWNGDLNKDYGGASYASNGVQDISANTMISICKDVSTDFSNIKVGEVVWMKDHIGIYVGKALAVECTPHYGWRDGVQTTAVLNMGDTDGYHGRYWTKHGKLPYINYDNEPDIIPDVDYTLRDFIIDVQTTLGAKVDGIAGEETLNKTITVSATMNNKHPVVYYIQKRLSSLGYSSVGRADGVAGTRFKTAVKEFQKNNRTYADGVITAGKNTWKLLLGMDLKNKEPVYKYDKVDFIKDIQKAFGAKVDGIYGKETLSKTLTISKAINNKHEAVLPIQKRLFSMGYKEVGKLDGIAGYQFDKAVKHFQRDMKTYSDGIISARNITWKNLLTK